MDFFKKIIKSLVILLIISFSIVIIYVSESKKIPAYGTIAAVILGAVLKPLWLIGEDLTDNETWKTSQRKLKRAGLLQNDAKIRISFAYLFRIKIQDKYFLVHSKRREKYQPVGGVYKFEPEERNYLSEYFPFENDDCIQSDEITQQDYRLLVKNKDLKKFVKRFNKTEYRENIDDLSREFVEEIFSTNILDKNKFGELTYKYCGRYRPDIEYNRVFKRYELLIADIVEVRLSKTQEELFKKLENKKSDKYLFATAKIIESCGVERGKEKLINNITDHTMKILSENSDKLIFKNRYNGEIKIKI